MARFFGRYEHSLDAKGRVILPSKFRAPFDQGGYLTQWQDGCLALWTPDEFDVQLKRLQESAGEGRSQRNRARVFAAGSQEVEIDRSGRMPIHPSLREFAGLESEAAVLVLGAIDRVELWKPSTWQEKVGPSEALLMEEED